MMKDDCSSRSCLRSPSCQEADPAVSDLELRSIYAKLDKNSNGEHLMVFEDLRIYVAFWGCFGIFHSLLLS